VITSAALGGPGRAAASERVVMGAIGTGGRGTSDLRGFLNFGEVQVVAVCDVRKSGRGRAKKHVDKKYGNTDCAAYNDFREPVARDDIDAVSIGTPDHWHAIPAIEACRRGKDVFCEKPLSLTIREGRAMVEAARHYGRVFSSGSQRVMGDHGQLARYIHSGAIGEVREAYVNVGGPSRPCDLPGQPVPDDIDWDMWLGPAPWAPYHPNRCSGAYGLGGRGWRTWRDYSGGMMTDWGGHIFGAAMFALGLDETGPVEVIPPDGKDHPLLTYRFASGVRIYHAPGKIRGRLMYKGTRGEASGRPRLAQHVVLPREYRGRGLQGDFLSCVRTRQRPFRDVEYAHRVATVCHLGNIAYELNRPLKWDPVKEDFAGDEVASRMVDRPKRSPWRL
jgi:predicted dehydrogenase